MLEPDDATLLATEITVRPKFLSESLQHFSIFLAVVFRDDALIVVEHVELFFFVELEDELFGASVAPHHLFCSCIVYDAPVLEKGMDLHDATGITSKAFTGFCC